jgi:hypothetical protein
VVDDQDRQAQQRPRNQIELGASCVPVGAKPPKIGTRVLQATAMPALASPVNLNYIASA